MNHIRKKMFTFLLGIFTFFSPIIMYGEDFALSPEEIEQYVAEMEQEYKQMLASFTPEEREQWEKEQEEIEKIISNMDEKELNALIEEMMQQPLAEIDALPQEQKNIPPTPVVSVEQPIKEKPPLDISKYESILELLDDIIKRTDSFLVKVHSIPDMELRIDRWVRVKKITSWPEGKTWNIFTADIEQCMQELARLKEKDPQTGLFKYLDALKKQDLIINSLERLKKILYESEPRIAITSFGLEPISGDSRKALKTLIIEYSALLYGAQFLQSVEKIFAEFEPEAQKRRTAVETARTEAAKPISTVPGTMISGGYPYTPTPGTTYPSYTGGYSYPTQSYTPSTGISGQTYQPPIGQTSQAGQTGSTGGFSTPQSGTPTQPAPGTPTPLVPTVSSPVKNDYDADRLLTAVETGIIELQSIIRSNNAFNEIRTNLTDATKVASASDDFIVRLVPLVEKQINTLISDINALARRVRVLPGDTQNYYIAKFKSLVDSNSELIQKLSTSLDEIQAYWSSIPTEKQLAYFKTTTIPMESVQQVAQSTLFTLRDGVNKLLKMIPQFPTEFSI